VEWGVPVHADQKLFEMLCLEGAQAGLSWLTILRKRANYAQAFDGFDAGKMSRYGAAKRQRLLLDPGIVRNRLKVDAFIANARAYLAIRDAGRSFDDYIWQFTGGRVVRRRPLYLGDIAPTTFHSDAMSKDLKQRGFASLDPPFATHSCRPWVSSTNINVTAGWHAMSMFDRQSARLAARLRLPLAGLFFVALSASGFTETAKPVLKALDVFDLHG